jgi:hypothetical protein
MKPTKQIQTRKPRGHVCHADRFLPRCLEPVFTALAGNIANHDYKAAQRLALFIVEVDKKIGTPALKRIVQLVAGIC